MSARGRILAGLGVVTVALLAAVLVLLPLLQKGLARLDKLANGRHGLGGALAQSLLPTRHHHAPHPAVRGHHHAAGHALAGHPRPLAAGGPPWRLLLILFVILLAAVVIFAVLTVAMRWHARRHREYLAWPIRLTGHDQTVIDDLRAAVGSLGDSVAEWPRDRWRTGQSCFGVVMSYDPGKGGQLCLALICEARHVRSLDGALQQAYPNVRIGCGFKPEYSPVDLGLRPGMVVRLQKAREPFRPVINRELNAFDVSPVLEGLGEMLHTLKQPAAVWFCCRPETRASAEIGEGATFHVEVQIAGPDLQTCRALHAKLRNLPGARNELVRRPTMCHGLYRRRFSAFTPPVRMGGKRKLMTASELAGLLELPSARLKAPIERYTVPRADGPAEIHGSQPNPAGDIPPSSLNGKLTPAQLKELLGITDPYSNTEPAGTPPPAAAPAAQPELALLIIEQ